MSKFEKEELLWEPETGMENEEVVEQNSMPLEVTEDVIDAEFEIPDIPSVIIAPCEPKRQEVPKEVPAKSAKQQLKEMKEKYRQEKKRMRGYGKGKLFLAGLLGLLLGGALGAAIMFFLLTR